MSSFTLQPQVCKYRMNLKRYTSPNETDGIYYLEFHRGGEYDAYLYIRKEILTSEHVWNRDLQNLAVELNSLQLNKYPSA